MDGGRGGHLWSQFEEYARQRESVGASGHPGSRNPLSPTSGRLHREDMAIYGQEPATDKMMLAVCNVCQRVVKTQALLKHKELYHLEPLKVPPPKRPYHPTPVQTIGQSSASHPEKKSKEYDPDRHCGVWLDDKKRCRKSLTCKIHPQSLRQQVLGRSRPFTELLAEHKRKKQMRRQTRSNFGDSQPNPHHPAPVAGSPPLMSPGQQPVTSPVSPSSPLAISSVGGVSVAGTSLDGHTLDDDSMGGRDPGGEDSRNGDGCEDDSLQTHLHYPKPAAVCSFSSREGSNSQFLFSRRLDSLRSSLVSLTNREKEFHCFPSSSMIRKFSHLRHRTSQRKYAYFGKQNHILLQECTDEDIVATPFPPFSIPPSPPSPTLINAHSSLVNSSEQTHTSVENRGRHSHTGRHVGKNTNSSSSSSRRDSFIHEKDNTVINGVVEEPAVSIHGKGRKRGRRSSKSYSHHQDDRLRDRVEKERTAFVLGVGLADATDQMGSLVEDDSSGTSSSLSTHIPMGVVDGMISSSSEGKSLPLFDNHVKKMADDTVTDMGFSSHHQLAGLKSSSSSLMPNGIVNPGSPSPMSQQAPYPPPQTFIINPSSQISSLSRSILPIGSHPFPTIGMPGMPMLLTPEHQMLQRLMAQGNPALQQQQGAPAHMWIPSSVSEGAIAMGNAQNEQGMGPPDASSLSSSGEILIHNSNNSNNSNNCHADSRDSLSDSNHQPVARASTSSSLVSSSSAPMRIRPLSFCASISSHNHLPVSRSSSSSSSSPSLSSSSSSLFWAVPGSQSTLRWNQNPRPAGLVCQSSSFSPIGGGKSELCLKQPSQSQTPQHLPQRFNRFPDQ